MFNIAKVMEALTITCNGCGAPLMYHPKEGKLWCERCGNTQGISPFPWNGVSNAFIKAPQYHCAHCGSKMETASHQSAFRCPSCGTYWIDPYLYPEEQRPEGLLPFRVTKNEAEKRIQQWLGQGFFYPSSLKKAARIENLKGVYVPSWWFAMNVYVEYEAEVGYYYTEKDAQGNVKQKVRWEHHYGKLSKEYQDRIVAIKDVVNANYFRELTPSLRWDDLLTFNPLYTLGFEAYVHTRPEEIAFEEAKKAMEKDLEKAVIQQLPGDTYRNVSYTYQITSLKSMLVMVALWVCSYDYRGKKYQVLVNGWNGAIKGEKPIAWWKVLLVVLLILAVIGLLWWWFSRT